MLVSLADIALAALPNLLDGSDVVRPLPLQQEEAMIAVNQLYECLLKKCISLRPPS